MRRRFNINELIWFIILLSFSYYFYKLIYTGDIRNFMHPKMVKYVYLGFIALGVLTIYQLFNILTERAALKIKYGYIMFIIPLFLGLVVNPKGLDAYAVQNRGISVFEKEGLILELRNSNSLEEEDYIKGNKIVINDKNYLKLMNSMYKDVSRYKGKSITVRGFVYKGSDFSNNEFVAARMMVSCCAADAEVIGFMCRYDESIKLKEDQWVELTGVIEEYKMDNKKGVKKSIPLIRVEKVSNIREPENKYIYP